MAGIGFELRQLMADKGHGGKLRAYAYAGIMSCGTMMLSFVLLIGVQLLARALGVSLAEREALVVVLVYTLVGSLLLCAGPQMLLTRFVSDQIYMDAPQRVMPSLFGGAMLVMIPGGVLYGLLLWKARGLTDLQRVLAWSLFMEMSVIWLQMAYISAVREYRKVLAGFALGVLTTVGTAVALLFLEVDFTSAVLLAMFCGYGVMLVLYSIALQRRFPAGNGSCLYFLGWVGRYPAYLGIGFFSMAGAYVHMLVAWFGPNSEVLMGVFRHAPLHDAASFYAFLVTLPASVCFVLSVEVYFFEKYRDYFRALTEGGTLPEIETAREQMERMLRREISRLAQVQVFVLIPYAVLMRYFLEGLGFTRGMISTFQALCAGYSAFAIGNCLVLLLLYFNDRRGALFINFLFFLLNLCFALWTTWADVLFNDMGLLVAGSVLYILALFRLLHVVRDINYRTLCGQPPVVLPRSNLLTRLAARLDRPAHPKATLDDEKE